MKYSIVMTSELKDLLIGHLIREDGQEDLCFGLWYPGYGKNRKTAILNKIILPESGDRNVHGNVSYNSSYFSRVLDLALEEKAGVVFMHSHPYPGWQGMSKDDFNTEYNQAAAVKSVTGLPIIGMTLGTDGSWSGRFWEKTFSGKYERFWCENVRIVGENGLEVTYNDELLPHPDFREELKRTVSAWGNDTQHKISRLKFGIVGLGSVGSIVAESLVRMGVQNIKLIDFDVVEKHNLDRLLHANNADIGHRKVEVIANAIRKNATAAYTQIQEIPLSVTEEGGMKEAIDCDIIFSCVDRPWARHILNYIAYAYLIPVIDGGISVHTRNSKLQGADWRMHAVFPTRRCLLCIGQYDVSLVNVERQGSLDDQKYIEGLPDNHTLKRNENIFPFSGHLASSLVLQMLSIVVNPLNMMSNVGEQVYHFVTVELEKNHGHICRNNCFVKDIMGRGDTADLNIIGPHPAVEKLIQNNRLKWQQVGTSIINAWKLFITKSKSNNKKGGIDQYQYKDGHKKLEIK